MTESPAKAQLREFVDNKLRMPKPSQDPDYASMSDEELQEKRSVAQGFLVANPNNERALKRYDLLVAEIERRKI